MNRRMRITLLASLVALGVGCSAAPAEDVGEQSSALPVRRPPVGKIDLVPRVVFVPSQYATIQAGVDALTAGGRVVVAPGTYVETVLVSGKRKVTIDGAGITKTKIVAAGPELGAVNFASGASGGVSDVAITGGAAGVVGSIEIFDNPADASLVPGPVTLRRVFVSNARRGVSGVFPSLTMESSFVWDAAESGIQVRTDALSLANVEVHRVGGFGVTASHLTTATAVPVPCSFAIAGGKVADTGESGIALEGRCTTSIQDSVVTRAHVAGIDLLATGPATIDAVDVSFVRARTQAAGQVPALAGEFGDAIRIWSSDATVSNSHLANADRAGISVMGCGDAASATVRVTCNVLACNGLDFAVDQVDPWSAAADVSCDGGARLFDPTEPADWNAPPAACENQCSTSGVDGCDASFRKCKTSTGGGIRPVPEP
jgi:hypothetical protein